jgi:hypothetical protein
MPQLFAPTLQDQVAEVEREVGLRVRVYRRRVDEGKMTQEKADRGIEVMSAVGLTLRWLQKNEAKIKAALGAALLLAGCAHSPPAVYTPAPEPLIYWLAPGGAHVPLAEPIERMP